MRSTSRIHSTLLLCGIIILAIFLRSYNITAIPSGIYPDEANNATDAITAMTGGHLQWFYPANNGREGLFLNIIALSFKLFGIGIIQLKLPSILMGTFAVIGIWFLARELFPSRPRLALIAAYLTTVSLWAIMFSRIAFRANMLVPVLAFAFALFLRGVRTQSRIAFALGGLVFGLGFHTYIAFRIAPVLFVFLIILFLMQDGMHFVRTHWRGVALYIACAFISAAPILWTFHIHPEYLISRSSDISVFAPSDTSPLATLTHTISTSLLQFNVMGDQNWRHNYPPLPQLEPLVGVFFIAGIMLSLFMALRFLFLRITRGIRNRAMVIHWFLLAWFVALLSPAFMTTEGLPHALRSIGTIPPVFIFAALAIDTIIVRARHYSRTMYAYAIAAVLIFCVYTGMFTAVTYFALWGANPAQAAAFHKNLTDIGTALAERPHDNTFVYVVAGPMERLPIQILTTHRADVMCVYPDQLLTLIDTTQPFTVVFPSPDAYLIDAIAERTDITIEEITMPLNSTFTIISSHH